MTTRDCRLTLLRARGGRREAENFTLCILVDLSYKLLGLALPCTQSDSWGRSGWAPGQYCLSLGPLRIFARSRLLGRPGRLSMVRLRRRTSAREQGLAWAGWRVAISHRSQWQFGRNRL